MTEDNKRSREVPWYSCNEGYRVGTLVAPRGHRQGTLRAPKGHQRVTILATLTRESNLSSREILLEVGRTQQVLTRSPKIGEYRGIYRVRTQQGA